MLQECFRKLDGVDVGTHELFTPHELLGGLRCPAVIVNQKWSGQSKIAGGAARWTAVELGGQLTFISTRDRTQICSSQQMYGEVEISSEFLMASQVVEVEHCKNYNVNTTPQTTCFRGAKRVHKITTE